MTDPGVEYIRYVLSETGWNAAKLARKSGVAHSTINRPLTQEGYSNLISRRTLQKVFAATGIDPAPFLNEAGEPVLPVRVENHDQPPEGQRLVPVYDISASAGHGALVGYEGVAYSLAFPPDYLRRITSSSPTNLTIISVKGDSMTPTLNDDDIVLLDMSKTSLGYEGLFVIRIFDVLHVKRLSHSGPGRVMVISDNKDKYPPKEYPAEEIEVVGKVLWAGGKV